MIGEFRVGGLNMLFRKQAEKTLNHYKHQWESLGTFDQVNVRFRENTLLKIVNRSKSFFNGKKVLVAGCGYGWETLAFYNFGANVRGVDLYIEKAREYLNYHNLDIDSSNIEIVQQDIESLKLPLNYYDYIYCNGVLHHTESPEIGLKKLVDVLKPGGELLLGLYENGGNFWTKVNLMRRIARFLSKLSIKQEIVAKILNKLSWYKGTWSNRFPSEIERIVWTIENLYVPTIKTFSSRQVEDMLRKMGMTHIFRWDDSLAKFVRYHQIYRKGRKPRLKTDIGYLLYRVKKSG